MSEFGTSINDKKRFILRNPDGTFAHCLKTGEKDSALELDSFRIYRLLFFLFFISEMGLTCFLMFLTWEKREGTIITVYCS